MRIRAADIVDVFAYLLVLGLFVQFFPAVITESFGVSLLTAVLLKVALEGVLWVKQRVLSRLRSTRTAGAKVVPILTLVAVMPGSKFLVLGLTDLAFGDAVQLGGFFLVTLLIVTLMVARGGVRRLTADAPRASAAAAASS